MNFYFAADIPARIRGMLSRVISVKRRSFLPRIVCVSNVNVPFCVGGFIASCCMYCWRDRGNLTEAINRPAAARTSCHGPHAPPVRFYENP